MPEAGVIAGETNEEGGVDAGRAAGVEARWDGGTNGGGAGVENEGGGGDAGAPLGRNGGVIGGGLNSGSPDEGDGGVAVAAEPVRSIGSGLGRGAAVSTLPELAALGGTWNGGRCGGAAEGVGRCGTGAASRAGVAEKIPSFQVLRGVCVGRDALGGVSLGDPGLMPMPDDGVF